MWRIYAEGGGWGHRARTTALTRLVSGEQPDCLIVDTFPRGIRGELVLPRNVPKILIHRDLNPRYVEWGNLREFVAEHYSLVIAPGEGSQFPAVATAPWLMRSAHELSLPASEEWTVLVIAAGRPEELGWYGAVVRELRKLGAPVRCVAPERPAECPEECWVRHWPAIELMGSASVVVGGAGYNTVYECLAWDVPLVARPWPRMYDRQELRAERAAAIVYEPDEAARAALAHMRTGPGRAPQFVNGAEEAVRLIQAHLRASVTSCTGRATELTAGS